MSETTSPSQLPPSGSRRKLSRCGYLPSYFSLNYVVSSARFTRDFNHGCLRSHLIIIRQSNWEHRLCDSFLCSTSHQLSIIYYRVREGNLEISSMAHRRRSRIGEVMATGEKLWLLISLGKVMRQTCKSSMNTGYCCGRMSSCKLLRLFHAINI